MRWKDIWEGKSVGQILLFIVSALIIFATFLTGVITKSTVIGMYVYMIAFVVMFVFIFVYYVA